MSSNCKTKACREAHAKTGGQRSDGRSAPGYSDGSYNFGEDLLDTYEDVHSDVHSFFAGIFGFDPDSAVNDDDASTSSTADAVATDSSNALTSWFQSLLGGLSTASTADASSGEASTSASSDDASSSLSWSAADQAAVEADAAALRQRTDLMMWGGAAALAGGAYLLWRK